MTAEPSSGTGGPPAQTPQSTEAPLWVGRLSLWHAMALGLVVRLVVLALLPDQGFPDAKAYLAAGRNLFASGNTGDHTYMPLYPIWTYLTGGGVTLKLADIALSLATIWVIYALSLEILRDRAAALLAAFVAALWPHFAFYAVSGLTETAYTFIVTLGFLMLYRKRWWWGIVLLALSVLIRPTLEPLIPILLIVFAVIVHRENWRVAVLLVAKFALVYVVVMSPWWVHQYARYGQFVRLNLGFGIVMYSGNNPTNRSGGGVGYLTSDGRPSEKSDHNPSHPAWAVKDPIARDRALTKAAVDFIRNNPGHFVTLAAIKFVRFWRLWPYAKKYQTAPIIAASLLSYGVMLAATLIFLLLHARSRWRVLLPVFIYAAFLTAVHMITIGSIRYRFPLEPFLMILGCYTLARLLGRRLEPVRH